MKKTMRCFPRDTANHPGGQSGSPDWFHHWSQAISANNITYSPGSSLYGECPGMLHWSYSTSQNKDVVIVYDTAATEDPGDANADHGKKATTGIDTFEDTYLHEHYHTVQIDQADNVVGIVHNTPWRYGWSWNQSSHNHWSKGADGQPGVAGTDDDTNGTTDDLIVSGPGELGHGDDVLLDSGYNWPQASVHCRHRPGPGVDRSKIKLITRSPTTKMLVLLLTGGILGSNTRR